MDFSKLTQHERTAAIAAAVVVIAGLVATGTYTLYSLSWLAIIASVGLVFVVLQPQIASGVNLPGSRGSLMVLLGGIAGIVMVLALLTALGLMFSGFGFADIMFLIAVAAGVVAAWASWQQFQAEGGKFQLGSSATAPTASPAEAPATPAVDESAADEPMEPEERRTEA